MGSGTPYTYLFVPGNRPERFHKAASSEADRIILDLEDAVAPADKGAARQAIAQWLRAAAPGLPAHRVLIRINAASSADFALDLQLLRDLPPCGAMLPKSESGSQPQAVRDAMQPGTELLALVETAAGIQACPGLASHPAVSRLALGALDLMVDLNVPADSPTLVFAAAQLVLASRAAGLPAPVAGGTPSLQIADTQGDMAQALRAGFGAKMCIHPNQLAAVRQALMPSAADLEWATQVVQAWGAAQTTQAPTGALQVNGKMVDRPVYLQAQEILERQQRHQSRT